MQVLYEVLVCREGTASHAGSITSRQSSRVGTARTPASVFAFRINLCLITNYLISISSNLLAHPVTESFDRRRNNHQST